MTRALAVGLALAVSRVLASDGANSGSLEVKTNLAWSRVAGSPGAQSEMYRVIRSEKAWAALLHELDPRAAVDPAVGTAVPVDFANWMLLYIAVPSTAPGSNLSIEYAYNFGTRVEVNAVEIRPTGPECATTGGNGMASIIALIPRSDLPVYFAVKTADLDCRTHRGASVR